MPETRKPLSVPDDEVAELIGYPSISRVTRNKLRRQGKWPPNFYIAGRSFVLTADIEEYLQRAKEAAATERAKLSERGRKAVAVAVENKRQRNAVACRRAFDATDDAA